MRLQALLPLTAVALLSALLPLAAAIASDRPLGDLLLFPLNERAWDPSPSSAAFTLAAYIVGIGIVAMLLWLVWPRQPSAASAQRPERAGHWPKFVWLAPLCALAAVAAIDGGAGNAAIGLVTLALTLILNADTERRTGTSLISQRRDYFLLLFPTSLAAGWLLFYWLNLFVGLWVYPDAIEAVPFALGKSIDYATLLPALLSLRQWLASFPGPLGMTNRGLRIGGDDRPPTRQEGWLLMAFGSLALLAGTIWPDALYWLFLAAPLVLAFGIHVLRQQPTSLVGLQRGDWSRPLLTALAALALLTIGQALNLLLGDVWMYRLALLGGPMVLQIPGPVWVMAPLLYALLGLWLADQLTDPFRQRPQHPPFRPRAPVKIPIVDLLRQKDRD